MDVIKKLFDNFKEQPLDKIIEEMYEVNSDQIALKLCTEEDKTLAAVMLIRGDKAGKVCEIVDAFVEYNVETKDDYEKQLTELHLEIRDLMRQAEGFNEEARMWSRKYFRALEFDDEGTLDLSDTELDDRERFDYSAFYKWFRYLLKSCTSCFERDVLRSKKDELWNSWKTLEEARLKTKE